jgi:hypothetical protein
VAGGAGLGRRLAAAREMPRENGDWKRGSERTRGMWICERTGEDLIRNFCPKLWCPKLREFNECWK